MQDPQLVVDRQCLLIDQHLVTLDQNPVVLFVSPVVLIEHQTVVGVEHLQMLFVIL